MRYFFVSYFWQEGKQKGIDDITHTTGGSFLNRHDFKKEIIDINNYDNIDIISILELNKEDFKDYVRT